MRRSALWLTLLLCSCANIIDLQDRKVIPDAGTVPNVAADGSTPIVADDSGVMPIIEADGGIIAAPCVKFCADAKELCTADHMVQDYSTDATCYAVCAQYSADPALTGNTLACRQDQLNKLRAAGPLEAQTYCPGASPGGGAAPGEPASSACGSNCVGFCALRAAVCPASFVEPNCVSKCLALPDTELYNADANFGSGEDSLECRIAHLSAAALYGSMGRPDDRDNHCSHSGIRSKVQCDVSGKATINCADFCKIADTACAGDSAVYESDTQCQAFCAKLVSGTMMDDSTVGTVRCARAGAYDALEVGPAQCPNAGPAPDRCGSGRCEGYCLLAQQGCGPGFALAYPGGQADCQAKCGQLSGAKLNDPYSVTAQASKNGNTLQCRLLRITRVLAGDSNPLTCTEALGGGACQ